MSGRAELFFWVPVGLVCFIYLILDPAGPSYFAGLKIAGWRMNDANYAGMDFTEVRAWFLLVASCKPSSAACVRVTPCAEWPMILGCNCVC